MITQTINLDLSRQSAGLCLYAKQGDADSRYLRVCLTNQGQTYTPTGVQANFRARKPDGTMVYNPAVINADGSVTVELTEQTLAVAGPVLADVCLCGAEGQVLSSASFMIMVDAQPYGDRVESTNEWQALLKRMALLELDSATEEQVNGAIADYLTINPPPSGAVFTPTMTVDGTLSWTNNGGLENPQTVDLAGMVVDALGAAPVFGMVDYRNNIVLSSLLPDGIYLLKYEDNEGNQTQIGSLTIATEGQEEEEEEPVSVNLFDAAKATLNSRWSNSSFAFVTTNGYVVSDYIPVTVPTAGAEPSVLRWRGGDMAGSAGLLYYDAGMTLLTAPDASVNGPGLTSSNSTFTTDEKGDGMVNLGHKNGEFQSVWQNAAYIRLTLQVNGAAAALSEADVTDIIVTVDQPIE